MNEKEWSRPTPLRSDSSILTNSPANALPPILRICGIIHCVKCELDDRNSAEVHVSMDTLCSALEIANYYREQAIFAYGQGNVDIGTVKAERVIEKIKAKNIYQIR